jgi:hypothetical protein
MSAEAPITTERRGWPSNCSKLLMIQKLEVVVVVVVDEDEIQRHFGENSIISKARMNGGDAFYNALLGVRPLELWFSGLESFSSVM